MTIHGYPDWQRLVQRVSDPLIRDIGHNFVGNHIDEPIAFCGSSAYLNVRAVNNSAAARFTATFYSDQAATVLLGIVTWDTFLVTTTVVETIPVVGNWVRFSVDFNTGVVANGFDLTVTPSDVVETLFGMASDLVVINVPSFNVPGAGNVTFDGLFVGSGNAQVAWIQNANPYALRVEHVDYLGNVGVLFYVDNSVLAVNGGRAQVYLPRRHIRIRYFNGAAGASNGNVVSIVARSS